MKGLLRLVSDIRVMRVILVGWACTIFFLSLVPDPGLPRPFDATDKVLHLIAYGFLGFFFVRSRFRGLGAMAALILVSAFGGVMEILQHFFPPREASLLDQVANTIGVAIGSLLGRERGS